MPNLLYATDEDLAVRASADFAVLCPRDQKVAAGQDGWFGASDLWTLRSSTNFAASGVAPGHVVQLLAPSSTYRPPGEALVVQTVSGSSLTLRRKGLATGSGQPPGPSGGLIGVEFLIVTLGPQIDLACREFDRRYGLSGAEGSSPLDPRDIRDAIVLSVLHSQYQAMSRDLDVGHGDSFASKALALKTELDELLARLVVRSSLGGESSSRFSTRLSR